MEGMSQSTKKHALRLIIYLHSAGHTPSLRAASYFELATALAKEYSDLPPDVRKSSRSLGRKLIRAAGLKAACRSIFNAARVEPQITPRPKCPTCKVMRLNKAKSIWETKEGAEAFCSYFGGFTAYPCPAGIGWHVTRRKLQ
jgi:hypothetical protein